MMKLLLPLFLLGATSAFAGEETRPSALLGTRPNVPCIEVCQWRGQDGFVVWSPQLTLAQVLDAVGGFRPGNDRIEIMHLAADPAPDLFFKKNQLMQDPNVQRQTFHPGDRLTITRLLQPY